MASYRIYLLTSDNHFKSVHNVECTSDEEVFRHAAELALWNPGVEIWCGDRLVRRISPVYPPPNRSASLGW